MNVGSKIVAALPLIGLVIASPALLGQTGPAATSHLMIADPANLSAERANSVYLSIRENMRQHYAASGDPVTGAYQTWRRYNTVPYRSALHGALFVNNYANPAASRYGHYEHLGSLPAGSIVVKDSFAVTETGEVMTGPLFLMEKREAGFNAASNDWLYMLIEPSGTVTGITKGKNAAAVRFCAECHNKAPGSHDNLYFLPEEIRRRN